MTWIRLAMTVRGIVYDRGFGPFAYGAATARGLSGWVRNEDDGVKIEVQGLELAVYDFVQALRSAPPGARLESVQTRPILPVGSTQFRILGSARATPPPTLASTDAGTRADGAPELETSDHRR